MRLFTFHYGNRCKIDYDVVNAAQSFFVFLFWQVVTKDIVHIH